MKADELRQLLAQAERQEHAHTLAAVARIVGIGEGDLVGRDRRADTVQRRAVAAWILVDRLGWPVRRAAHHLRRTPRQVLALLRAQRAPLGEQRKA